MSHALVRRRHQHLNRKRPLVPLSAQLFPAAEETDLTAFALAAPFALRLKSEKALPDKRP